MTLRVNWRKTRTEWTTRGGHLVGGVGEGGQQQQDEDFTNHPLLMRPGTVSTVRDTLGAEEETHCAFLNTFFRQES